MTTESIGDDVALPGAALDLQQTPGISPEDRRRAAMKANAPFVHHQMEAWIRHVDDFGYTRKQGDKMPRANVWRPYRFAVQDVIFALTALRHAKEHNCIEVDVYLAFDPKYLTPEDDPPGEIPEGHDIYPYEPLAAAKALTLMLLSEAFRCGCPLRLKFTRNVERTADERQAQEHRNEDRGRVPFAILQLAGMYGIEGVDAESGVLEAGPGAILFRRLTGFPPDLDRRIEELAGQGLLTMERACYLVQHGVWAVPELEGLIRGCPYPDLVLDGEILPEQRHLYHHVQIHTRTALLGGVLDRALSVRDHAADSSATGDSASSGPVAGKDVEDDDRQLLISYDPELAARRYRLSPSETDPMRVPRWLPFPRGAADGDGPQRSTDWALPSLIPSESEFVALLRARDEVGLLLYLADDIAAAEDLLEREPGVVVAVVVPLDFNDLQPEPQAALLRKASDAGVGLLVCPETTRTLDGYAFDKLNRSRVLPE
jgi:hypothetical protein